MRQRGRKSAAALALVPAAVVRRVVPPATMPDEQKAVWHSVVNNMPPGWFGEETLPLLEQYCVHVCRARMLRQIVDTYAAKAERTSTETSRMLDYMRQEHRQSRLIASLATKMRIAQQSTYDKSARKRTRSVVTTASKPWEADDED